MSYNQPAFVIFARSPGSLSWLHNFPARRAWQHPQTERPSCSFLSARSIIFKKLHTTVLGTHSSGSPSFIFACRDECFNSSWFPSSKPQDHPSWSAASQASSFGLSPYQKGFQKVEKETSTSLIYSPSQRLPGCTGSSSTSQVAFSTKSLA